MKFKLNHSLNFRHLNKSANVRNEQGFVEIIDGYKIIARYPAISIGVNACGRRKTFRNIDLEMSETARRKIDAYWAEIEKEYRASNPFQAQYV